MRGIRCSGCTQLTEHGLELVVELLPGHLVIGRVAQRDPPLFVDRHAVVRIRQIFRGEPEVDGMPCDIVEGKQRHEPGLEGLFASVHQALRLADHLDVAHRVRKPFHAKVKIVEPKRLLELCRILLFRNGQHGCAVVEHVVALGLVGAVGQPVGMLIVGRVGAAARNHDNIPLVGAALAVVFDNNLGHRGASRVGRQPGRPGVREQIRIDGRLVRSLTQIGARIHRGQSHLLHIAGHRFLVDRLTLTTQLGGDVPRAIIRVCRVDLVNAMFERLCWLLRISVPKMRAIDPSTRSF